MSTTLLSLNAMRDLAAAALRASRTSEVNATLVADMLVAAEADGLPSHGLSRAPFYADQAQCGKVDGFAVPEVRQLAAAAAFVDARDGFARPAIAEGARRGMVMAAEAGIALVTIGRSHHCGAAGFHVEQIAEQGFLAIACGNTPAAMAPWGGRVPLYGTNPLAFACPRVGQPPLVIDLSLSHVARGKILIARQRGTPIPADWALNTAGEATTDPAEALAGSLLPAGGAKGAALALMVEILSAALTGSNFAYEASSFLDAEGPPPRVGQCFIIIDPRIAGDRHFAGRVEVLLEAIVAQPGPRLPGARRLDARARAAARGVEIPTSLYEDLAVRGAGGAAGAASNRGSPA